MEDDLDLDEEVCKGIAKMGRRALPDYFHDENRRSKTNSPPAEHPESKPDVRKGVWSGLAGVTASNTNGWIGARQTKLDENRSLSAPAF